MRCVTLFRLARGTWKNWNLPGGGGGSWKLENNIVGFPEVFKKKCFFKFFGEDFFVEADQNPS